MLDACTHHTSENSGHSVGTCVIVDLDCYWKEPVSMHSPLLVDVANRLMDNSVFIYPHLETHMLPISSVATLVHAILTCLQIPT